MVIDGFEIYSHPSHDELKAVCTEEGTYGLFDFDLWLYDIGFGSQVDGVILPFEQVAARIDERMQTIKDLLNLCGFEGYFTGTGNFRYDIAVTQPYKGNRSHAKPYHFENIKQYLIAKYNAQELHGIEADDMLAARQRELGAMSIIISRDKDLKMVKGWHYGYECGKQGEQGPFLVDTIGEINEKGKGYGQKFFWAQMLIGDTTDHIVGCRHRGKKAAYDLLSPLNTVEDMAMAVALCYQEQYGEDWYSMMLEQGRLLWMHDVLNEDGTPVLWQPPECVESLLTGDNQLGK